MARKLTVTHNGQTFTRKTDRTYTHVILAKSDYARDLAHSLATAAEYASANHAYYVREADPATRTLPHSTQTLDMMHMAARMTADQWAEHEQELITARFERDRAAGKYEQFGVLSWCGRNELAHNAAGKARNQGWAEVVIVPVPPVA